MNMYKLSIITTTIIASLASLAVAAPGGTPVIIKGEMLPHLLGASINTIRVFNTAGVVIPFQIDEVTDDGEYVLDRGEIPNTSDGNGVLDKEDEIVFLWGDLEADSTITNISGHVTISIGQNSREARSVFIRVDANAPLSQIRYIEFNPSTNRVQTPYYYADLAKDRFHFLRAGVKNFPNDNYIDLTNELRVDISLRALFGLIPIRYDENSMVCLVRRYKVGPIRLIRRGDFHLNLGLGVRGSRARVNQICYPQIVEVPVRISLPVNFRTLFNQAHIELTPVIRDVQNRDFRFSAPSENLNLSISRGGNIDTLHQTIPTRKLFTVTHNNTGYGWTLETSMNNDHLGGSGFVMRRPSSRASGVAECGLRLAVRDVPRGNYYINNRVFFSDGSRGTIENLSRSITLPIFVGINERQ